MYLKRATLKNKELKQTYLDIKNRLLSVVTQTALDAIGIPTEQPITVEIFNDQIERIKSGEIIPKSYPLLVVGWEAPNPWKQLGNGVQMLDPFDINIHIFMEYYNNNDSDVAADQNLIIYDLKQLVFSALQEFEPTKVCKMVRISDTQDDATSVVTHWVQKYRANLIDVQQERPIGGIPSTPPYTLEETNNKVDNL